MLVAFADRHSAPDRRAVERRLAQALSGLGAPVETAPATVIDEDVSSRELLQRAWDRAEEEIEALQAELRLLRQRHQEAERQLLARIHQRKRLQQTILDSAGESRLACARTARYSNGGDGIRASGAGMPDEPRRVVKAPGSQRGDSAARRDGRCRSLDEESCELRSRHGSAAVPWRARGIHHQSAVARPRRLNLRSLPDPIVGQRRANALANLTDGLKLMPATVKPC